MVQTTTRLVMRRYFSNACAPLKEVAMATMKQAEELKKSLSKLKSKTSHKIAILKAKTSKGKEEL